MTDRIISQEVVDFSEDEMIEMFTDYMRARGELTEDEKILGIGATTRVTQGYDDNPSISFYFDMDIEVEDDPIQPELPIES